MPRFLSGHLCPEISGSFLGSVLGTSAVRQGSSCAALVRHGAGGLRGLAQGHREAAEEVAEPGLRLPARCASLGAALQDPELGYRSTVPFWGGLRGGGWTLHLQKPDKTKVPKRRVARCPQRAPGEVALRGLLRPSVACRARLGSCAVFVVGSCHATRRRLSGEAQGQVWLSPVIPQLSLAGRQHLTQLPLRSRFWRPSVTSHPLHGLGRPPGTRGLVSIVRFPGQPTLRRGCPCTTGASCFSVPGAGGTKLGIRVCWPPLRGVCPLPSGFPSTDTEPFDSGAVCNFNLGLWGVEPAGSSLQEAAELIPPPFSAILLWLLEI